MSHPLDTLKIFDYLFNRSESPPAAGRSGKTASFENCLRQFLKEAVFP